MRYVVVDDEPKIRQGLAAFLTNRKDCEEVASFGTASAAYEYLSNQPVDVLLTDIRMPGLSGLELIERLRTNYPDLDIIIISGYGEFGYAQKALELGVRQYLTKPTDLIKLTRVLDDLASEHMESPLPEDLMIRNVISFMEHNLDRDIRLSHLADIGFVTPNYLCRRFKELTNSSPMEYLTRLRLEKAKNLLQDPSYSVEVIAQKAGYNSRRSFSRAFNREYGLSPQDFRNKNNQE
ncbi:MAG TPA: response regulator [Clostridiaceae bacterium]|nr:response regulator [Clostridiaceae bacterium]